MSRCYKYAIARFAADHLRDERLNLGIVIFKDHALDVKIPKSLDKLRAISAALNLETVRNTLEQLPDIYSYIVSQGIEEDSRIQALTEFSAVDFSSISQFSASSDEQYNGCVDRLLHTLVEPEPAPQRQSARRPTKLLSDVKSAFRSERVLARKGESLEAHRIVSDHKIAEGLPADLLLKNGAMHVIQTVDASVQEISAKKMVSSIAISALVFEQARMTFGESQTKTRLVYKASSALESFIAPSLDAAEHQGAVLVNWESRDDRTRFVVELSSLAEPLADIAQNSDPKIHASVQPKFRLN